MGVKFEYAKQTSPDGLAQTLNLSFTSPTEQGNAINSTKLQKELGWEFFLQFGKSIKKTVKWYFDHRDWMDNIPSGEYEKYYEEYYRDRK